MAALRSSPAKGVSRRKSRGHRRHLGESAVAAAADYAIAQVFSWHQADGRYSVNNRFPAFTVEAGRHALLRLPGG